MKSSTTRNSNTSPLSTKLILFLRPFNYKQKTNFNKNKKYESSCFLGCPILWKLAYLPVCPLWLYTKKKFININYPDFTRQSQSRNEVLRWPFGCPVETSVSINNRAAQSGRGRRLILRHRVRPDPANGPTSLPLPDFLLPAMHPSGVRQG